MAALVENNATAKTARYAAEKQCLLHIEYLLVHERLKAIMLELVCANSGMELSRPWLAELQRLLKRHGAVLIVDEIMTAGRIPGDVTV
jgi:glutamate-1-semialdehyde aminotransferase